MAACAALAFSAGPRALASSALSSPSAPTRCEERSTGGEARSTATHNNGLEGTHHFAARNLHQRVVERRERDAALALELDLTERAQQGLAQSVTTRARIEAASKRYLCENEVNVAARHVGTVNQPHLVHAPAHSSRLINSRVQSASAKAASKQART